MSDSMSNLSNTRLQDNLNKLYELVDESDELYENIHNDPRDYFVAETNLYNFLQEVPLWKLANDVYGLQWLERTHLLEIIEGVRSKMNYYHCWSDSKEAQELSTSLISFEKSLK
jgi:hypothetical protein